MRYFRQCFLISYIVFLLFVASALTVSAEDDLERQFRILFISSYGFSNDAVPQQLEGFEKGMEGVNVDISYEFMDADKYYGGLDIQNFDKFIRYKIFSIRNYDLIVVADDPALRYAINNRSELFPDTPLVFLGVNNMTEAVTAAAMRNATGISESLDFEGNYALMKKLFPTRNRINVIVDSSVAGQGDYVEFMKFRDNHPEISSRVINTSYYTANGIKEVLGNLGKDDIILFLDFSIDGQKRAYSLQHASDFISNYAPNVPIFRLTSANIEHGVFGGISYSYYEAGRIAGDVAKRILSGASANSIPLVSSRVTTPFFEQSRMDRFGIGYKELPKESVVINEHDNFAKFYRENTLLSNLVIVIIVLMIIIILLLNRVNSQSRKTIRTDFLTQMPNRKSMMEDINQAILANQEFGLIMLDVDYFKDINDTYGHKVGDEIIVGVAERLKKLSDKRVVFARLGGDEFCGIFTSPSKETAKKICTDILKSTKAPFKTSEGEITLTVSIGCAIYPLDTTDPNKLMECADSALYVTKENGRNGYTLYSSMNKT
ncbi:ABC transporter substrate binding protein [Butyrivibrio sp. LC3010]|uniref:ABC transporter substrate binding protein n=1 Tax=Butyrivibrio sp. LC3010 TaxID=1280680 RepID=UPI00041BFB04|nr:ABC transporter substrate binding protein [Butyrivibrio sp. LC3010]